MRYVAECEFALCCMFSGILFPCIFNTTAHAFVAESHKHISMLLAICHRSGQLAVCNTDMPRVRGKFTFTSSTTANWIFLISTNSSLLSGFKALLSQRASWCWRSLSSGKLHKRKLWSLRRKSSHFQQPRVQRAGSATNFWLESCFRSASCLVLFTRHTSHCGYVSSNCLQI